VKPESGAVATARERSRTPEARRWPGRPRATADGWPGGGPGTAGAPVTVIAKEAHMNWDRIEGNWKQLKGKAKVQWGKLTDDHLDVIAGKREQLVGRVQEQYGVGKDEAERQVDAFAGTFKESDFKKGPRA
jgi:uncharacterized protein YjbJ (UPF0337 family)